MNAVSFDTLAVVRRLKAAGFSEDQAEAVTGVPQETRQSDAAALATKADLREVEHTLKNDLREVALRMKALVEAAKSETIKWVLSAIGFQAVVVIGAIVPLSKDVR